MKTIRDGVYTNRDLSEMLGSNTAVQRALVGGKIERVGERRYYATPGVPLNAREKMIAAKYHPELVVSKLSILRHYELTTRDSDGEFQMDAKNESSYRGKIDSVLDIYRTKKMTDVVVESFNGVNLKCYSIDRAIFEALEIEGRPGSLCREVLSNYTKKTSRVDLAKLAEISKLFGPRGDEFMNILYALTAQKKPE